MKHHATLWYIQGNMSIAIGSSLPEFSLLDQDGKSFNSKQELANAACVIYFYPKNFTPGCTMEACSFRDAFQDFSVHDVKVIAISSDSENSHKKFADKFNLPFTLLADEDKVVRNLFKVQSKLLGLLPGRETFVFDAKGKLVFKFDAISAGSHIKKALAIIQDMNDE